MRIGCRAVNGTLHSARCLHRGQRAVNGFFAEISSL